MNFNKKADVKVLLIVPPCESNISGVPLGLAYIAAVLEEEGAKVEIIDAAVEKYSLEEVGRLAAEAGPDIVGITMMSPTYGAAMRTVDVVKESVNVPIVIGGPHPSALPEQCLRDNQNVDFAIVGEGEYVFARLIKALFGGAGRLDDIAGVVFRRDGRIINNGRAGKINDLDRLPLPARWLLPIKKYKTHPPFGKKHPFMTVISSRGCPYKCTYCSKAVFGSSYRAVSAGRLIEEIKFIINEYGIREIHFYDDDFTMDMERAADICDRLIEEKIKISWSCTTRVNLVNEQLLRKMKRAGCWLICYGVESADDAILEKVKKGYTVEQVKKAFRWTRQAGIRTVGYFMLGLPGETIESSRRTMDFSLKLDPDFVAWGMTALFPGSKLYDAAKKGEFGETDVDYKLENKKTWHASGSPFGEGFAIIFEDNFTRQELKSMAQQANRDFYLRPAYILRFLFKIRSFHEFFHYLKGGIMVLFYTMNIKGKIAAD